jgi:hypothetical protein
MWMKKQAKNEKRNNILKVNLVGGLNFRLTQRSPLGGLRFSLAATTVTVITI